MLENYLGKNVEITVAFAFGYMNGGSVPRTYVGVLQSVDTEYCYLTTSAISTSFGLGGQRAGRLLIKKEYILTCFEPL